jgi:hypothetical protein
MNSFVVESYDNILLLQKEMESLYPSLSKTGCYIAGQSSVISADAGVEVMPL